MKENHTYVAEKNEEVLFSAEIRVVGSYTDRLLTVIFKQNQRMEKAVVYSLGK